MPPFRRQLLPPERLAEELKRVRDGVLVRLPLAEFDSRVERAARAVAPRVPPRLLEARYHATLRDEGLVGDGQWKLVHKGPRPGLLKLEPFNLALRQARFESSDALVAAFDDRTPSLLVEAEGVQTVSLDWSARAEARPEGLQFRLEVPSCPVALLELDVPVGRAVNMLGVSSDALLSGPHPAESPDLRRWKIVCGGRDTIDLRIRPGDRPTGGASPQPALFVRQKTTQKLSPEGLDAVFELTLEGASRGVRELTCECDPELRLRDVAGTNVAGCSFQAGAGGASSRLTIRLGDPVREGTWQVSCLAPLSRAASWRSPTLRVVGGVSRGETLDLYFHPDVHVETWDPGGFRLTASSGPDADRPAGTQHLTLVGGGVRPEGAPADPPLRPRARLQTYGTAFRARELAWWRCDAAGMGVTVQIGYEVSQGRLFRLPVRLPAEWAVERVEMSPSSLLRSWRARGTMLHVDLARPLLSPEEARRDSKGRPPALSPRVPTLTVHLRPAWSGPVTGRTLPFPVVESVGARFREGALALDCDERLFHLEVRSTADRSEPEPEGPWGQQPPDYYYRYRGTVPSGSLVVRPRPPRVRARCSSEVYVASGRAAVETRLLLEAEVGSPDTIDLSLSEGDGGPWQWRAEASGPGESGGNGVRRAERLAAREASDDLRVLAAANPLQAAALVAARPVGERWRLTLARPLRAREPLRLLAIRQLEPRDGRWRVPLPVVLGAGRMEGEVTLHLAGADLVQVQSVGLREAAPAAGGTTAWRTFRYGQSPVELTLGGQALSAGRAPRAVFDRARLVVYADAGRVRRHHFSFRVANWDQPTLPILLPPGSTPLAVQVDDHWLPRLASPPNGREEGGALELALPVPGRGEAAAESVHRYEVIYTRAGEAGLPWQSVEAPAPALPGEPLSLRRLWRLPPEFVPLRDSRYQPVAGTAGDYEPDALPRRAVNLFYLPAGARMEPLLPDDQAGAREALAGAALEIRAGRGGQVTPLRELVGDLAFVRLRDRYPLVVDVLALREAEVGPDTPVSVKPLSADGQEPPWAACGLVAVPARSAVLLTTATGRGAALREPLSGAVEQALAAAVARGQDPSGRFRSALSWLPPEAVAAAPPQPPLLGPGADTAGWGEWEPVAGLADDRLVVVRRDAVSGAGLALAVLMGLFFWLVRRRSPRWRRTWLLAALAVAGTALFTLPSALRDLAWWPLVAGCLGAGVWYFKALLRPAPQPRRSLRKPSSAAATAVVLLVGVLGWGGRAAAPVAPTVYLVPGPPDAPENQTVLVPADLLDRLKALARPAPLVAHGPQAVLLDATYDGRVAEGEAEFAAVFSAYCPGDGQAALALPLDGVRLVGDVWADGARADPMALPAPRPGYSVTLRGAGRHKVEFRFRVPVVGTPEDRNVLFTVPPLVRSRLTWHVPPGASHTQALVKHGAQWTTKAGPDERLEADLGRLPAPLHLHWHQAVPARTARVQYRAAYLWDLHLEASRLTAWLRFHVPQGAVQTLEVDLPADLEVLSANARRTPPAGTPAPAWLAYFGLRDWHVEANGPRRLHLELPYPVSGDFQVMLELAPRGPLPALLTLPLPSPRGEAASGPHYLAYRGHPGLDVRIDSSQFVTRVAEGEFAPDWPGVPRPDPGAGAAYTFHPDPDHAPSLRLHLHRRPPAVLAECDVAVQVGPQLADVQVAARLQAPDRDLAVVEWELASALTVAAVTGDDVRSWKQTDRRLLVWLNRTTSAARMSVSGWVPLNRSRLELAGPRLPGARQHTRLRLAAAPDLALAAVRADNMRPAPAGPADRDRTFEADHPDYGIACDVQSARAAARVLTFAEVNDRQLNFTTTVQYEVGRGELGHVRLRLRNWEPEKVRWEAERVAQYREPRRAPGDRSLVLDLQPGVTGSYRVVLRGSLPVEEAAGGVPLPDVQVVGVDRAEYLLAVAGSELSAEARGALARLPKPAPSLAAWPGAAQRVERTGGQAWRVQGSEWQLRLVPHARATEPAPVRVFLWEQTAVVADGRRWLHEARCWLRHEAHADLNVNFPAPARVVAASVDGAEVAPLQPGPSRLWLPLPGQAGVRCVRLHWLYERPEPLERPDLAAPQVADALAGPALWTAFLPAGWEAAQSTPAARLGSCPLRDAALALYRAEAQLRICQDLCKRDADAAATAALTAAQRRFALYCRHAGHALDVGADRGGLTGPDGRTPPSDWLADLRAENRRLAARHGFESVRADAERRAAAGEAVEAAPAAGGDVAAHSASADAGDPLPHCGMPISWHAGPGEKPPELQLAPRAGQRTRQALAASGQWLGVLVVVWVLSFLPFLMPRLRLFWPEQLALLAAVGWHLAGPTLVVLLLLSAAVVARLFLLARGLRRFFRRRRNQPSTMTAASGAGESGASDNSGRR